MSSYLRAFKALEASDTLYQLLHVHILTKQIDQITKEAYQIKGQRDTNGQAQLPIQLFIEAVKVRIINGSLRNILRVTTDADGENYVGGYSMIDDCLWPLLIRAVDTSLSFVTSTANLEIFQVNYRSCEKFIEELREISLTKGDELLEMFNLSTYSEFIAMELADKQV